MSTALVPTTDLVAQINSEHRACEASFDSCLQHAVNCGNLLREVRVDMPHGQWGAWIEQNFEGSQRTAEVYIQVADAHFQNPDLIKASEGTLRAAVAYISKQAGGDTLTLKDPDDDVVDAEIVPEPVFSLTLAQLVSLARKRWHRPPDEKDLKAWLKDTGIGA